MMEQDFCTRAGIEAEHETLNAHYDALVLWMTSDGFQTLPEPERQCLLQRKYAMKQYLVALRRHREVLTALSPSPSSIPILEPEPEGD